MAEIIQSSPKRSYKAYKGIFSNVIFDEIFHPVGPEFSFCYECKLYLFKKLPLSSMIRPQSYLEVLLIEKGFLSPYIVDYVDYVIEQETVKEQIIENLYVIFESAESDLYSYIRVNGPLATVDFFELFKTLVQANIELQNEFKVAHRWIIPQNVAMYTVHETSDNKRRPKFKVSFFDDLVDNDKKQESKMMKRLTFKAPEVLYKYKQHQAEPNIDYEPSKSVEELYTHFWNAMKVETSVSDVFSAGIVLLYAATKKEFNFKKNDPSSGTLLRTGENEQQVIKELAREARERYSSFALEGILLAMTSTNPFSRPDFEEIGMKLCKLKDVYSYLPLIDTKGADVIQKKNLEESRKENLSLLLKLQEQNIKLQHTDIQITNLKNDLITLKLKAPQPKEMPTQQQPIKPESTNGGTSSASKESKPSTSIQSSSSSKTSTPNHSHREDSFIDMHNKRKDNKMNEFGQVRVKEIKSKSTPGSSFEDSFVFTTIVAQNKIVELTFEQQSELNSIMSEKINKFELNGKALSIETKWSTDGTESKEQVEFIGNWLKEKRVPYIEYLDIRCWNIYDEVYLKLADGMTYYNSIKALVFKTAGRISDFGLKSISRAISTMQALTTLSIAIDCMKSKKITEKGIQHLANSISHLKELTQVEIQINPYSKNEGEVACPAEIAVELKKNLLNELPKIAVLTLIFNHKTI